MVLPAISLETGGEPGTESRTNAFRNRLASAISSLIFFAFASTAGPAFVLTTSPFGRTLVRYSLGAAWRLISAISSWVDRRCKVGSKGVSGEFQKIEIDIRCQTDALETSPFASLNCLPGYNLLNP
jgi:hypothetical protein